MLATTLAILIAVVSGWAVPGWGTAHSLSQRQLRGSLGSNYVSRPVHLREVNDRGLLVDVWLNGSGPYVLAVDTGAGVSILRQSIVDRLAVTSRSSRRPIVGGLSTTPISSNREVTVNTLAIGDRSNVLSGALVAAVADTLPQGIDGILDPNGISPFGYSIDLTKETLEIFDSTAVHLRETDQPRDGAVVRWIRTKGNEKPLVRLGDGRLALLDTGSSFGLAVSDGVVVGLNHGGVNKPVRDLGGGTVASRRVKPTTVTIGALELRNVPTDFLTGVAPGTPVLIGRAALYPFRITFDPVSRLIAIEPSTGR